MGNLAGKNAFVTGGSRGIGAAIVDRLAREGANVAFTWVSKPDMARETAQQAQSHGVRALALSADSADAAALTAAVHQAATGLGGIDILVNNAGIALVGPVTEFPLADFDRTYAVNVRAVFVATQAVLGHMPDGGRIINISSCNAERVPIAGAGAYAMSKAALVGLTKGLARDLGPRRITINNIQPGPVSTDMNPPDAPFAVMLHGFMAIPRHADAGEIAGMVAYLAGPEADFITGASFNIDGGFTA